MASGATPVKLTLTATVITGGSKTNTASVTGDQYDPTPSNNVASASVTPTGTIGSFAFWDLKQDGIDDPGDPGVANVTVELLQSGNVIATTTTNSQGNYQFTGVNPGNYQVKFITPSGTVFSTQNVGSNSLVNSNVDATGTTPVLP